LSAPDPLALPRLPRDAGGPVFAEPWQAQAFALVLQLHTQGAFTWTEWAAALSERLKAAGADDDPAIWRQRAPSTSASMPGKRPMRIRPTASPSNSGTIVKVRTLKLR